MNGGKAVVFAGYSCFHQHLQLSSQKLVSAGACEKFGSDLRPGRDFHWVLWFPPPVIQLASHDHSIICLNMVKKVTLIILYGDAK